jgi:hypothetical protein
MDCQSSNFFLMFIVDSIKTQGRMEQCSNNRFICEQVLIAAAAHGCVNKLTEAVKDVIKTGEFPEMLVSELGCLFHPIRKLGGRNWKVMEEYGKADSATAMHDTVDKDSFNVSPNVLALFHAVEFQPERLLVTMSVNHRLLRINRVWRSGAASVEGNGNRGIIGTLMGMDKVEQSITKLEYVSCPYVVAEDFTGDSKVCEETIPVVVEPVFSHQKSNLSSSKLQKKGHYLRHISSYHTLMLLKLLTEVRLGSACDAIYLLVCLLNKSIL